MSRSFGINDCVEINKVGVEKTLGQTINMVSRPSQERHRKMIWRKVEEVQEWTDRDSCRPLCKS
jgi:hypothetical protein